ncbi:MAG: hypothetical protein IJU23_05110 [Proteobacteria bacterium]|nr:hypothetical protein [Pseudomonadota bacterium]
MVKLKRVGTEQKQVNEMSTYARSVGVPKYSKANIFPNTIKQCLNAVNNIWKTIATNMIDDRQYVMTSVESGYTQINELMDRYRDNETYHKSASKDLACATNHYGNKEPSDFETIPLSNSETNFRFNVNCSTIDATQRQLLIDVFKSSNQINRTEKDLHCKTTVCISGDIIAISITFSVV